MRPPDFYCPANGTTWIMEDKMNIRIKLSTKEVKEIVKTHVLKEVPIHTVGKDVYVSGGHYSDWEVEITDVKEVEDATL